MNGENPVVPDKGFILSDANYARMKLFVQTVLPAVSTLYFTLGSIWGLPAVEQVIGSLAALATFLGVLLGISSRSYNASEEKFDGTVVIQQTESGGKLYSLELKGDPAEIDEKKVVTFKVGTGE